MNVTFFANATWTLVNICQEMCYCTLCFEKTLKWLGLKEYWVQLVGSKY